MSVYQVNIILLRALIVNTEHSVRRGLDKHRQIENSPNEDHMLAPKIRTSPNTPYLTVPEISHSKQNSGDSGIGLTNDFDLMDMLDASPFSHDAFLPSELDILLEDVNTPPQLEKRIVDN